MRRIRYPALLCDETPKYFELKFPPHAEISRVSIAQVRGDTPATGCTLEIYSSPTCQTLMFGTSSLSPDYEETVDPDNIAMNPRIYRVMAPITLTAGNLGEYVKDDGGGAPYIDDEWRMQNPTGKIYIILTPGQADSSWDLLFDIERK